MKHLLNPRGGLWIYVKIRLQPIALNSLKDAASECLMLRILTLDQPLFQDLVG